MEQKEKRRIKVSNTNQAFSFPKSVVIRYSLPTLILDNNYDFNKQPELINKQIVSIVKFIEKHSVFADTKTLNKYL